MSKLKYDFKMLNEMKSLAISVLLFVYFCSIVNVSTHQANVKNEELLQYFHNPESKINFKNFKTTNQRIADHAYPVETHNITTEDGYIITVFRIPFSHKLQNSNKKRAIVLLQHGLFSSSDSWLLLGPNNGLPFMLADAGFDVWLGNSRGNIYGRRHTNISLYSKTFWHFSWHEIGYFDLPAIIDYALEGVNKETKHNSLHYIGFSQGTTAALVMLSTRPQYNKKIKTSHLLAPVAYVRHLDDQLVRTLAPLLGRPSTATSKLFTAQEFLPQNKLFVKLSYNVCNSSAPTMSTLCSGISYLLEGDRKNLNKTALKQLSESHPAGCSSNQIIHYMQEQQNGRFRAFDFGTKYNQLYYDQNYPPDYPLSKFNTTLHLWHGDSDKMSTLKDVAKLAQAVPNSIMHRMEDPEWAHGHFILHNKLKEYIHQPLISILKEYERKN